MASCDSANSSYPSPTSFLTA